MFKRLKITALILILFASVSSAIANEPVKVLPIEKVKTGMRFYGYSTLGPNGQTKFTGKVWGVLTGTLGPKHKWIVTQLDGANFKETGVIAGQSGSPVYVRIHGQEYFMGTVSYAPSFSKNAVGFLTPAEEVLATDAYSAKTSVQAAVPPALSAKSSYGKFFEGAGLGWLSEEIERGYVSINTVAPQEAAGPEAEQNAKVRPGDVLAVQLAYGDFTFGSFGTVSYVDEMAKKIYLFGHPLRKLGPVQYRLVRAKVLGVRAGYDLSNIIAAPAEGAKTLGVITQDRETGIMGVLGQEPKNFIPFNVKVTSSSGLVHENKFFVTNDITAAPLIGAMGVTSTIASWSRAAGPKTVFLKGQLVTDKGAIALNDVFHDSESIDSDVFSLVFTKIQAILENDFKKVSIQDISIEANIFDEIRLLKVEKASLVDNAVLSPGSATTLKIAFSQPNKDPRSIDVKIDIPQDLNFGTAKIVVGDADSISAIETHGSQVVNLKTLLESMNQKRSSNKVYIYLVYPPAKPADAGAGEEVAKGVRKVSKRLSSSVEEFEINPAEAGLSAAGDMGDFVIEGSSTIEFKIGDKKDDKADKSAKPDSVGPVQEKPKISPY